MRHLIAFVFSLSATFAISGAPLARTVVDGSGAAIPGAQVVLQFPSAPARTTATDLRGAFTFDEVPAGASLLIMAEGFEPLYVARASDAQQQLVLQPATATEEITVQAPWPHQTTMTATKTDTPLRDVPQSITVITRDVIAQQTMQGMADVTRYVPGVGIAQGEGNRDTPVFRGNSSTSDFYVDGVKDDVQYFRDLYNVERVEALKGPNAMIFGRGGVGGVLNRVTRQAEWDPSSEVTLQLGAWNDRRGTADFGHAFSERFAARVTSLYQSSDSYRDGVTLNRSGVNPTVAFALTDQTTIRAGYEFFHDGRTADRGISSYAGRPVVTDRSTFFGSAEDSHSRADVHVGSASIDHRFSEKTTLRSRVSFGDYDKFYQNVFPGAVDAAGVNVNLSAYNNATTRQNLFNQTDLVWKPVTGRFAHTILTGVELGRQVTDNFRETGYFNVNGKDVTSVAVPLTNPTLASPVSFRQSATDADNHSVARVGAIYAQDQIELSPRVQVIAGLRYDDFRVEVLNNRTNTTLESHDGLISPRLGLVYKPVKPLSLYASYSLTYLPRAGEQLASLSLSNQALSPEEFRNYEVGAKMEIARRIDVTASLYRLDRKNVAVTDPADPTRSMLVDGQRSSGVELSATGNVTRAWSVVASYALQEGEILESLSATARAGARLAQLPRHSASLWNRVDVSPSLGLGLGVVHRDEIFTSTDNTVTLPAFTRLDAALFYTVNQYFRAQVNIENLLDTEYFSTAHSNNNITPGAPRAVRVSWMTRF